MTKKEQATILKLNKDDFCRVHITECNTDCSYFGYARGITLADGLVILHNFKKFACITKNYKGMSVISGYSIPVGILVLTTCEILKWEMKKINRRISI